MDVKGFFPPNLKSNIKRQNQTLLAKAATLAYLHINTAFSLKMSIHVPLKYNTQSNFIRNQMLPILSARYRNSNCTIDKQPPQKKHPRKRNSERRFPITNNYRKHQTNATNQNNKAQESGKSQQSALVRVYDDKICTPLNCERPHKALNYSCPLVLQISCLACTLLSLSN